MTKFIVDGLHVIALILFWLIIVAGGIMGSSYLQQYPISGFILGSVVGIVASTFLCGTLFLLLEINQNLRTVVAELAQQDEED